MFTRNGLLFLLNKTFNYTTRKRTYVFICRSCTDFHFRYLCSNVNKTGSVDKNHPTKRTKIIEILSDLDFVDNKKQEALNSVKSLSKDISFGEKFIKLMRCEGKFDMKGVINTLENYNHFKTSFIRPKKYIDEIKSSPEFNKFLKGLEENISNLEGHHLISALSCLHWFGVSKDTDLFTLIMLRIIENLDNFKLNEAVFVLQLVRIIGEDHNYEEDILLNELSSELKLKTQNSITRRINSLTESELIFVLRFLRDNCKWPDEALIKLLNSCYKSSKFWNYQTAFGLVYVVMSFLKDEFKKKEYQLKFLLKLFDYTLNENIQYPNALVNFAQEYAFLVRAEREPFDEKIYNSVMDSIMNKKLNLKNLHAIVSVTILTRYIRKDVLMLIKQVLFKDVIYSNIHQYFPSRNEYFTFYRNLLDIVVCSEFQMSQNEWYRLKSYLKIHPILTNVDEWKSANELKSLRLALSLAALDVFPNKVLEHLFENIHLDEDSNSGKNDALIVLNQAASLLNLNHPKSFLAEDKLLLLSSATVDSEGEKILSKKLDPFVIDITETLKTLKISCLTNLHTKLGHNIGIVIAMNRENQFFQFKTTSEYVEDISVPSAYKLILVLPFMDDYYCRNWLTLRSNAVVIVKSLEAMGYEIISILYDKWVNLSNEGKKKFLLNKFKEVER